MKIALVVGHRESSQGASNKRYDDTEWRFNTVLAKEIKYFSKHDCVIIFRDDNKNGYRNLPRKINDHNPDLTLSLHCNAFNTKASGHEVLYWSTSESSKDMAVLFNNAIHECLLSKDRGIKPIYKGDRGANVLRKTKAPCVLLEPCFIDNDADYLSTRHSMLGLKIATVLNNIN